MRVNRNEGKEGRIEYKKEQRAIERDLRRRPERKSKNEEDVPFVAADRFLSISRSTEDAWIPIRSSPRRPFYFFETENLKRAGKKKRSVSNRMRESDSGQIADTSCLKINFCSIKTCRNLGRPSWDANERDENDPTPRETRWMKLKKKNIYIYICENYSGIGNLGTNGVSSGEEV